MEGKEEPGGSRSNSEDFTLGLELIGARMSTGKTASRFIGIRPHETFAANAAENDGSRPAAVSASTRWMAVSWACRRAHMASGDGAVRNDQQSNAGSASESAVTSAA